MVERQFDCLQVIGMSESSGLSETKLSSKVLKILCHLYENVVSLEEYARAVISSQSCTDALIQSADSASYVKFLKSTIVCTPSSARLVPQSWLLQQHSRQDEIVLRVIERIRQREGRASTNLLVLGYRLMSDDPGAQISSLRTIEYRIPNSNTSRLQYTPWKILLSRIGDDAMEFLLETRAVFVPAVSTCYVQLTGTPMYELSAFSQYCAQNQTNAAKRKLRTSLLNDSKHKSRQRQRHRRSKMDPRSSSKEMSTNCVQPCESDAAKPKTNAALVQQEHREQCSENEQMETEVEDTGRYNAEIITQKFSETESNCRSLRKRKAEVNLNSQRGQKRRIISKSVSMGENDCDIGLVTVYGSSLDSAVESLHSQSPTHNSLQVVDSSQRSSAACVRNRKRRRRRKGKLCDGEKKEHRQKTVAFDHRLAVERTQMFYSTDLADKYPPRYILFDININSPLKLVDDILSVRIMYRKLSTAHGCDDVEISECCSKVKQRLLNIVQLIIRNHHLCRYRYLLQNHCSVSSYKTSMLSKKKNCKKHSHSSTTKPTPKLQVPVYCRGQKPSSSGLATTPVQAPQECTQPSKPSKEGSVQLSVGHLLEQHCLHHAVFLFARACSLRVIPTELFGSAANRNKFFQNIREIVRMGRYEQLSLGRLTKSVRVTHCRWMKEIHSNTERLQLLAKVLSWLMNAFVLPLIKSYFYVTNSADYRNRMFYYRKSVWKKIHHKVKIPFTFHSMF